MPSGRSATHCSAINSVVIITAHQQRCHQCTFTIITAITTTIIAHLNKCSDRSVLLWQVAAACRELAACTAVSIPCRRLVTNTSGAIHHLVQFAAACNRSRPHAAVLQDALAVLQILANDRRFAGSVWGTAGCVDMLAAQLQACREREVSMLVCSGVTAIFQYVRMCRRPDSATEQQGSWLVAFRPLCVFSAHFR